VTVAAGRLEDVTRPGAAFAGRIGGAAPLVVPGRLRRSAAFAGDLLIGAAVVLCIPFVILAIAMPVVLSVRLLLWIVGLV